MGTAGETVREIINDILDFSKIEAGRVRMETIDFSPKHVTEEAVELFAEPAANKGVELILDVEPAVPHSVIGDPGRLRELVINLVGNAVKFTDSGEILVRVARLDTMTPRPSGPLQGGGTGVGFAGVEPGRAAGCGGGGRPLRGRTGSRAGAGHGRRRRGVQDSRSAEVEGQARGPPPARRPCRATRARCRRRAGHPRPAVTAFRGAPVAHR